MIARTANGKTTYHFYFASGARLAEETRPSGVTKTRYLNSSSGQILAEQRFADDPISGEPDPASSTWVWLLRDPDGNVATELKETAAGTVVAAQRAYDPYGSPDAGGSSTLLGERTSVLGYQSARTDEDTGNILLGARIYDPTTDRFTTSDTFVAGGADMSLATDPLTGNRYVFAAANPVAFSDDGHEPCARGTDCNAMYSGTKGQQSARRSSVRAVAGISRTLGFDPAEVRRWVPASPAAASGSDPVWSFLAEISGWNDVGECVRGGVGGCLWAAAGLIPITKLAKLARLGRATRGGTRVFRAVEPDELADLGSGAFRTARGLEGKYFWPTRAQADDFAAMATKANMGGPSASPPDAYPRTCCGRSKLSQWMGLALRTSSPSGTYRSSTTS